MLKAHRLFDYSKALNQVSWGMSGKQWTPFLSTELRTMTAVGTLSIHRTAGLARSASALYHDKSSKKTHSRVPGRCAMGEAHDSPEGVTRSFQWIGKSRF